MNTPARSSAFTLIELLVTISIIAVLIGLLLPALAGARGAARQADCLSDMHQMGIAITTYTNDYRETLPYPNWGPVATVKGWLYGPGVDTQAGIATDRQTGSLWPYIEADKVYRCPSHQPPYSGSANMTSYIMNGAVIGYGRAPAPYRIGQFRGDAVILWDGNEHVEFGPPYNDGGSFPFEIVPGHHGRNITCMGVDGSSVTIVESDFKKFRDSPEANKMWCNPGTANGH